jgi:hypothetical protein
VLRFAAFVRQNARGKAMLGAFPRQAVHSGINNDVRIQDENAG